MITQCHIAGFIQLIGDLEKIKSRDLIKRIFWVAEMPSTKNKYPQAWELELWHDDTEVLDDFKVGDAVECAVIIRGKIHTGRTGEYIRHSLRCVEIRNISPSQANGVEAERTIILTTLIDLPAYSIPKGRRITFKNNAYKTEGVHDKFNALFGPYNELYQIAESIVDGRATDQDKENYTAELIQPEAAAGE